MMNFVTQAKTYNKSTQRRPTLIKESGKEWGGGGELSSVLQLRYGWGGVG